MSSAKKTRELNRARTEHDNAKLSAQFAASNHAMLNIAESVLAKEIESLHQQLAECQATNGKLRSDMSLFLDSHEECEDFDGFTAQIVSMDDYHKAQDALVLPNDATALNELIAERTAELTAQRDAAMLTLENCRLLAARNRNEDWAKNILRFCSEIGVNGNPLRTDAAIANCKEPK